MSGEKNLAALLSNMKPVLNPGEFVFCCVSSLEDIDLRELICFFRESEGITLVVSKGYAERISLPFSFVAAWITLQIHSSLEAVGFTAAFSKVLTTGGIGCNVIAAYCHDHIFVNKTDAQKAMEILEGLSGASRVN